MVGKRKKFVSSCCPLAIRNRNENSTGANRERALEVAKFGLSDNMVDYRKRTYNKEKRALRFWILAQAKKQKALRYLGNGCRKCGDSRHYVLSFHHISGEKTETLARMFRSNKWNKICEELDKCEILCENCHREMHVTDKETKNKKAKKFLLALSKKSCEKCGYCKSIGALEFHHKEGEEKEFQLSEIRNIVNISNRLLLEIAKCEILCACCHRDFHFDHDKFKLHKEAILIKSFNLKEVNDAVSREEILSLHDDGMKQVSIAMRLGCSPSVICQVLKEHRNFYVQRIDDEAVKLLYSYPYKVNPYRISKILGFPRITVVRSLKRSGIWDKK